MGEPGKNVLIIIGMWIVSVSFKVLFYHKFNGNGINYPCTSDIYQKT